MRLFVEARLARMRRRHANELVRMTKRTVAPGFAVAYDVDLCLRPDPPLRRRPAVVMYDAARVAGGEIRPEHCLMAGDAVMLVPAAPDPETDDRLGSPAEYAAAGIEHYLRIEDDLRRIIILRYHLNRDTGIYNEVIGRQHWEKFLK